MKPYSDNSSKRDQIRRMFDNIAPRYDMLNHLLSLGIDRAWRKKLVRLVVRSGATQILDVATGTGDLAFALARANSSARIIGADLSPQMVEVAKLKVCKQGLGAAVSLTVADVERLPFDDGRFDAVTVAFGVRNFQNIEVGLSQMCRVLTQGGGVYVLEFSTPRNKIFGTVYRFYFHKILPMVGGWLSKDRQAYTYLPESVDEFPSPERFLEMMRGVGFAECRALPLMGGVAYIYCGTKTI